MINDKKYDLKKELQHLKKIDFPALQRGEEAMGASVRP